jgi:hypothetical protein
MSENEIFEIDKRFLLRNNFPIFGYSDFCYMKEPVIIRVIHFLRDKFFNNITTGIPDTVPADMSLEKFIAEYFSDTDSAYDILSDYLIEEQFPCDQFLADSESLFCLGMLLYGEDRFNTI